ncbi:MAG: alpha/beta fold hydrolase [Chloroflexi bacterium]|nr:alpha/beta fold hydrolase [Chloroflexota bacterium]
MPQIIKTAEPFLLPGSHASTGSVGCLLIHGFTGAPKEMRWMGEYLNREHGFTCLGIRLAGHATRPKDMIRSRWTDWTASVEDGYHLLCGMVDHVYLIGLSMGGALSLLMSTRLDACPEGETRRIKGVVTMSAPYQLPEEHPAWQIKILSYFRPYLPKAKGEPGASWFDKSAFKEHVSYPLNPIRSAAELKTLLGKMRAALPNVRVPVLMIHSKDDQYVLPENMEHIYSSLGASDKTKLYITGSGHVVPRDAARESAFKAAAEFINRLEHS